MRSRFRALARNARVLLALAILVSLVIPTLTTITHAATPDQVGAWGDVIVWGSDAMGKHDVLMNNGKVLFWNTGDTARIWDPVTGGLTRVPALFADLHCAAQVTLADGRVMVAGGVNGTPHTGTTTTAFFDPQTSQWSLGAPMNYERWYGTATTLPDGRVLMTSGDAPPPPGATKNKRSIIPEIYDPATNVWTTLPTAAHDQSLYPLMFVLPNGKAYEAGADASTWTLDYDGTKTWTAGPTNSYGTSSYSASAVMYEPGKIMRAGGDDPAIANASIIDMTAPTPAWSQVASMNHARRRLNLPILADGSVLAVGGTGAGDDEAQAVYDAERWDPATKAWTLMAPMSEARMYHSAALLLPDGRVLTTGGETEGRLHAQIYSPPYLFKGARPTITSSPSAAAYGTSFTIGTPDAADVTSVALIRPSAVTHAFDHNQRYVPLTFTKGNGTLTVSAPPNANYAPRGYYMLLIKNSAGVPSVASWVQMDTTANLLPGTITGKVTNPAGNPVAGATVSYSSGSTTTNAQGVYTLSNVQGGQHTVTVTATGYAKTSKAQAVVGGQTATLDFSLVLPGNITGKVTDSKTGAAIVGATVTYDGGTATVDATGTYTLTGLTSGSQHLTASAETYIDVEQTVDVPANDTRTVNFALALRPTYIAGEVRDIVSNALLPGATVSYNDVVTTTDSLGRYHLDAPPGTYTLHISMNGYINATRPGILVTPGLYTSLDINLDPLNPSKTFTPVADAYVNLNSPTSTYGTDHTLRLAIKNGRQVPYNSYLRFQVAGLTRQVQSAKVRLHVPTNSNGNASDQGGAIYSVADTTWHEVNPNGITANNAPAMASTPLSSVTTKAALDAWVEFDVTAAVTSNGLISFGLKTPSTDNVYYSSKEDPTAANAPQLVIQQVSPIPAITTFTPPSGPVGTEVTLTGQSFTGATAVSFNGLAASSFTVDSATQLRAVVPGGATTGAISVTNDLGSGTSASNFTVTVPTPTVPPTTPTTPTTPAPTIAGFSPPSALVGAEVTISGTNLNGVTAVTFNGVLASNFTFVTGTTADGSTQIRAVVPAGATSGKISVTTAAGTISSADNFIVTVPGVEITSFTPTSGLVGTEVTINGTGLSGATVVKFNGVAGSFQIISDSQIKAVVPNDATSGLITVTTAAGTASSTTAFVVVPPDSTVPTVKTYKLFLPNVIRDGASATTSTDFAKLTLASQGPVLSSFAFFCPLR